MKRATFNQELRWAIRRAGMSEAGFARHIGMSPTYLSRILNQDDYRPSPEMLRRFAGGLGLPVETVAGWSDIPAALGLTARPAPAPAPAEDEDEDDLPTVAEMIAHVEAKPGRAYQEIVRKARERLTPAEYAQFCADYYVMTTGNAKMVFGLYAQRHGWPEAGRGQG